MVVVDSNPYQFQRRQLQGEQTHCETCDITMMSKDWRSHEGGKKHRANKLRVEADKSVLSQGDVSWASSTTLMDGSSDSRTCNKCGIVGHIAKECTADVECRRCHEVGHYAKDCPKSAGAAFACHNCGDPGHKARECPEPKIPTCHNCDQKGHIARECPEPRVPKCKNCDEKGHLAKECPKPKDWSRVQCNNCGQMGHGAKRCPNPPAESSAGGGWDNVDNAGPSGDWAAGATNTGFDDNSTAAQGGWDKPPGGDDAFGQSSAGDEGFDTSASGGGSGWDNAGVDPNSGW